MRLKNSNKAIGVDDLFPLLFIVILFGVVIILFTYSHSKEEASVESSVGAVQREIESYDLLQKFLSTEVLVDLNAPIDFSLPGDFVRMNMAEFIKLSYHNPIYRDTMISEAEFFLQSLPKLSGAEWNIAIYLMPGDHFSDTVRTESGVYNYPVKTSSIDIPLADTMEYLQIKLFIVYKREQVFIAAPY